MSQPHLLLLGAGKSASTLIQYLHGIALREGWRVTVAEKDLKTVQEKLAPYPALFAAPIDMEDVVQRRELIAKSDLVISLLPPPLQLSVARDCLEGGKHFLSASYTDPGLHALSAEIKEKKLLFLTEMGLDPGIDHMSAMELIHRIRSMGGNITGFASHCGGLVAPDCDDNPWHYKFSWNPKNVILAGKAGAVFLEHGKSTQLDYKQLFSFNQRVQIEGLGELSTYPNRDSLSYQFLYGLEKADRFIRTTLRYPSFCLGWQWLIQMGCTREDNRISTQQLSHRQYFQQHLESSGYQLEQIPVEVITLLKSIGWEDDSLLSCREGSSADLLQWILEQRWALLPGDRDMIVMLHELDYSIGNKKFRLRSQLVVEGDDSLHTAMAKTVGLPLGIAAVLIVRGIISSRGLHVPIQSDIYLPVLKELEAQGIRFKESILELN